MKITLGEKTVWLNLHHLYYFKVIATEGGIAKAARKLNLGQPTLSAQLKQFEDSLDLQLFEREHKKLILTERGKIALDYANEIFRTASEMLEVLNDQESANRIHVQFGALDSVPKYVTLALTKAAYSMGNCSVTILEGKGDALLSELLSYKIDLMLANYSPAVTDAKGLFSRLIAKVPIVLCGSPKYKSLQKNFPKSLNQKPIILPTTHSKLRHDLDHYFKVNQILVDAVAETQDTAIQKLLAVDGVGIIAVPKTAVEDLLQTQELIEIGQFPGLFEEIYLISVNRKIENPISSKLVKSFAL